MDYNDTICPNDLVAEYHTLTITPADRRYTYNGACSCGEETPGGPVAVRGALHTWHTSHVADMVAALDADLWDALSGRSPRRRRPWNRQP